MECWPYLLQVVVRLCVHIGRSLVDHDHLGRGENSPVEGGVDTTQVQPHLTWPDRAAASGPRTGSSCPAELPDLPVWLPEGRVWWSAGELVSVGTLLGFTLHF